MFGFQLGTWFSVAMIGFAGAAVLYDTSNIIHHYPEDRYVSAAMQLFASIALMFWYVLAPHDGQAATELTRKATTAPLRPTSRGGVFCACPRALEPRPAPAQLSSMCPPCTAPSAGGTTTLPSAC